MKEILVTGATGYVGGRLIPRLLEKGYYVRALSRSIEKMQSRPWADHPRVSLVAADVTDPKGLHEAVAGCELAYYLVHSMLPGQADFAATDRLAAQNMLAACTAADGKRIIYLSGLGKSEDDLSHHLRSRTEVGEILRQGNIPVTILRAAIIIGSGSASFEILRYLVDRLPVMITPKWLKTPCQPIAIRNVIDYLIGCLEHEETTGQTYDIGGPEVLNYHELMKIYADEAGLNKRLVMPVPVLTPRLSSYWIHLVTPVHAAIARPLAEGLKNPVVCTDHRIEQIIPQELISCREAIRRAFFKLKQNIISSHWTDAGQIPPMGLPYPGDPKWAGGTLYRDQRSRWVNSSPEKLWEVIARIGGKTGWYHAHFLWRLRGFLDRMLGGVGQRRSRRDDLQLRPGDAVDSWRVLDVQPEKSLILSAEMKLPGQALLEFKIEPDGGRCRLQQTALFRPNGLAGIVYWYAVWLLHHYVFAGMIRKIARIAEEKEST
jgi:uncharacterized protein YbjT (DUF2867 family)